MITTVPVTETVNYYQIHWLKEDGEQGKHAEPVMMTASELSEYMEHLFHDWEYFAEAYEYEPKTFTALPISEEAYREVIDKNTSYTSDHVFEHICNQIEDVIGRAVIETFGFLAQTNVNFMMWSDVWKEHKNDLECFTDLLYLIPVEGEFYFRHQGICGNYFYSDLLRSPTWLEIILWSELGTIHVCDCTDVFILGFEHSGEMKGGYPVYECVLDRI
jgi:hypothetical protein